MALSRGIAAKPIVDAINANTDAIAELEPAEVLDDAGIAALVENEESALYAALVALIAAETA